jgi:2-methylcitrate dehydratase PrpD
MSAIIKQAPSERQTGTMAEQLARFAVQFRVDDVPGPVREYARLCMADAIGIGFASHGYDFAARSIDAIAALAGAGAFPVIGTDHSLPARDAALLNGILIHGLDFDDTHTGAVIHCSTSAVPLVLAEAIRHQSSGQQALAAFILALEADARIGMLAEGMLQKIGFHPTGLVGIFGCTLAAGLLSGLGAEQLARAQGIALSMASGSLEFLDDGSWTKRMHPGWAASSAITATTLAGGGFKGPLNAYEGRYGLYQLYLRELPERAATVLDDLGQNWETLRVAIKPYPVCHFNHACIDSMRSVVSEHGLKPADIRQVTALIHEKQADVVARPEAAKRRPQNDYEGKFSVQFAVAAAGVRGGFTLAELEDEALRDPEILALCDRVTFQHDPASRYPEYYSGGVIVETMDGRVLEHREAINQGAQGRALGHEQVRDKFMGNVTRQVSSARAEAVWDAVMNVEQAEGIQRLSAAIAGSD